MDELEISRSHPPDLQDILGIVREAFDGDEEAATLVKDLLFDTSAVPLISLIAKINGRGVGYILFSRAVLSPQTDHTATILAPLAVAPECQNRGIGGRLIEAGADIMAENGTSLAFVLGYPDYYNRHGFKPAGRHGLDAPYPIPEKNSDAWMVRELKPGIIGTVSGTVRCAETMDRPEYWRE